MARKSRKNEGAQGTRDGRGEKKKREKLLLDETAPMVITFSPYDKQVA